ncbi:glutaminyl-peptide cyclotransferase [Corynebacterium kozikiae]
MNALPTPQPATRTASLLLTSALLVSCSSPSPTVEPEPAAGAQGDASLAASAPADIERLGVTIHETLDFDPTAFTQGLEVDAQGDGTSLLVGTGWEGESRIFRLDPATGQQSDVHPLEPTAFGEGIARSGDTVWQLTWRNGEAIKRDATTLAEVGRVPVQGEGWGLCAFDDVLLRSDGTSTLTLHDPATFAAVGTMPVTLAGAPASKLNELECVDTPQGRQVYANVFLSTDILRIDATSGQVNAVIDASTVPNNANPDSNHVLNGIAAIPGEENRFYLTGKRWPDLYVVSFE